jgi:hypothetical protein
MPSFVYSRHNAKSIVRVAAACFAGLCQTGKRRLLPLLGTMVAAAAVSCYYPDPYFDTDSKPGDADAVPGFFSGVLPGAEKSAEPDAVALGDPSDEAPANEPVLSASTVVKKTRYSDLLAGRGIECGIRFIKHRGDTYDIYLFISNNSGQKINLFFADYLPFIKVKSPREILLSFALMPPSAGARFSEKALPPTIVLDQGEVREIDFSLELPLFESDNFSAPRPYEGELDSFIDVRAQFGYLFFAPHEQVPSPGFGVLRIAQMICETPYLKLHRER